MSEIVAELTDVTLRFGTRVVLDRLSLQIPANAITCLVGLSGAGKSTILRLLNGLRSPNEGRVTVRGRDLSQMRDREMVALRQSIGFSFQFAALFDSLSIFDNVALPLRETTKLSKSEITKRVDDMLHLVGLGDFGDRLPAELSGGMIKRAGFARAVISEPTMVLYDEPTTGLDPIITHVLTNTIVNLRKRIGGTAVVVSHDVDSIYKMADYVAMIYEGKIIAFGTLAAIQASQNPVLRQFLEGRTDGPVHV